MLNKKIAGLAAGLMFISSAAKLPEGNISAESSQSYEMNVSINLAGEKKAISPYIYGINDVDRLDEFTATAVRQGGNRFSVYNWENNYSNAGADWQHYSDTYLTNGYDAELAETPGACPIHLSQDAAANNVGYKVATVQMAGYVAADNNGTVTEDEIAPSARWKEVKATKGSELSLTPDTTDDYVYMDEYLNYLVTTLGDSTTPTGIQAYNLDNEPSIWNTSHARMHPEKATCEEIVSKSIEYASVVKSIDPNAEVYGLGLFGVYAYSSFGKASDWISTYSSQYDWFISYYLDQMANAEEENGKRLVDVIDMHYYSEDIGQCRVTQCTDNTHTECVAARVQSPRSLYDATYTENSWLTEWLNHHFPILPKINNSVDAYYPGTKIAFTEYNFGGTDHVSGAIAQADTLGAFADNNVYMAAFAPLTSEVDYALSAINLYTNYDGEGSAFGDTLVEAETEDISLATAYASINNTDDSDVTMVLSNKSLDTAEKAVVTLNGTDTVYKSAVVYAITQDSSDIRIIDVCNDVENNQFTIELPPLSVAQIVISDELTDKTITVVPEITTEEITYNISDLDVNENNYPLIPLGDKEHLVKAVINYTASSSSGATTYVGGGALCFHNLIDANQSTFWGTKPFSYGPGNGDITIDFNGLFRNSSNTYVEATMSEDYCELQGDWWANSENDESGADISVTYNTVTLYYEYINTEPVTDPTTETTTEDDNIVYGDTDCNGVVELNDAVLIMCNLADEENNPISDQGKINGDVYSAGDGINNMDALAIQKYKAQLISELPESYM